MDNQDILNALLCDELLGEILGRLQEISNCKNIGLVCRRWLVVQRRVKTSLGLCILESTPLPCFGSSVRILLSQYSHLLTLSVASEKLQTDTVYLDYILDAIGQGCKFLKELRFAVGPVTCYGLEALAKGSTNLTSLELVGLSPKHFPSLVKFRSLRELSLLLSGLNLTEDFNRIPDIPLPLERLCVEGIGACYTGLGWIWRNCHKLQKLELFSCEGIGDSDSSSFAKCLPSLQELQLRRCRSIANGVLMLVAEGCKALKSLVFYDGGDTEGLHHVVRQCRTLESLDLRLPLDLSNEDLAVIAENCLSLKSLRLHSCWLATGAGMKLLGTNMSSSLEELVLVRCRAVVQEPGTLTTLGQNLKCLKRLDLSDNDHLPDKELGAMLASCKSLSNLRLWRCRGLTDMVVALIVQRCQLLESVDITRCDGITADAVLDLILGAPKLRQLGVDESKLTETTKKVASKKKIAIIKSETAVYKRGTHGFIKRLLYDSGHSDLTVSLL
eukprot:Gb_28630 [translate_table: standard]